MQLKSINEFNSKNMEHPYKEYENTPTWSVVEQAITELVENNDIELQPPMSLIYILKKPIILLLFSFCFINCQPIFCKHHRRICC